MAIINTNIATITDSEDITLVNNPSFIIFKGLNSGNNTIVPFNITIKAYTPTEDLPAAANLLFTEINTLSKHTFQGTKNKNLIAGNSNFFYISTNPTITANNLASCIRNDGWFRSNFDISTNSNVITLLARRKNPNVSFRIEKTTANNSFIDVASTEYIITNNDTLFNSVVELDVYNSPTNRYITSASKTYVENDVWFDVNNVLNRTIKSYPNLLFNHNIIVDSGSSVGYYYKSKRIKDYETEYINTSKNKYVVDGFTRTLEENNLDNYIYNPTVDEKIEILTNNLDRYYNVGEDVTANIIIKDNSDTQTSDFRVGLLIKYYENNKLINENIIDTNDNYNLINSIYISADKIIVNDRTKYFDIVFVKVPISSPDDYYEISSYIRYTVLDKCNTTKGFLFLNRLGGWDSYYFNADFSTEFKTDATRSFKTLQPNYKISDTYEKVERKDVDEVFVIKSMADKKTADWLKELSTSKYVYSLDEDNRYVIVTDFDLSISDKDLFEVTMKYTFADTYNTNIK